MDDEKSYRYNSEILIAEMLERELEIWDENSFCECGAETHHSCECDETQIRNFKRRAGKKIEEEFGDRALELMAESRRLSLRH